MKILIVGPSPTKSKGGMATVIEEIVKDEDINSKFDIDVFESYIDGNKFKVIFYSIYAYLKFCITKGRYNIYHIHAASYGSTFRKGLYVRQAKRWGKKVILHIHGAEYMTFFSNSKWKKEIISILKMADMVIALSNEWKKKFEQTFKLTNCVVLENGINTERLLPAVSSPQSHPHNLVVLGRLGERKGTYDLIKAIKNVKNVIPDIKCYLAGDGEIEKCKTYIKNLNLIENVEVIGWIDFDDKLDLLKKSGTLVLPSYNEGLPMAILEGMACGKAIISTKIGAIPEVVSEENGLLIDPGDVNELSNAIIECCTNQDYLENVKTNNIKKIASKYSMKIMHDKLGNYYKGVFYI